MSEDICTSTITGRGKRAFKTRRQAERAARKSPIKIFCYACRWCSGWHHTHQPPKFKTAAPPSLKTLRGRLRNAALEIKAADRRLAKIEQRKADAELRAAHILKQSELQTESETQAIREMVARLGRP